MRNFRLGWKVILCTASWRLPEASSLAYFDSPDCFALPVSGGLDETTPAPSRT
jgi:hypothetical protein